MNVKYLFLLCISCLLLASSCSKEEEVPSGRGKHRVAFEIEITTGRPDKSTRADTDPLAPQEPGTCNVNRIKILVFKTLQPVSSSADDLVKFIYETTGVVTDQPDTPNGKYKAKGYFNAEAGASYRVIALAYLDTDEQYLNIDDPYLQSNFAGKNYRDVTISLKSNGGAYHAPEFFKGILRDETAVTEVISGEGDLKLKGFLYRAIGRVHLEINHIPADVTRLEFAVDRYSVQNYLYDNVGDMYIGFPVNAGVLAGERVLAQTSAFSNDPVKGRTARLTADVLRLAPDDTGSIFFVKATQNGTTNTTIIMSADQWIYTDYVGILEKVVSSNRFIVPTNYQLNVHGDFSALKAGNIMIEYSNEITDEVQIGILTNN